MEDPRIVVIEDEVDKEKDENISVMQEVNDEEEPQNSPLTDKTFLERVSDLLVSTMKVDGYSNNEGLLNFNKVIEAANKRTGEARSNIENSIMVEFEKFYKFGKDKFLKGETDFLAKKDYVIQFGKSGKANIPICQIYHSLLENNLELLDSIDAGIFFVLLHVCPDKDFEEISGICEEFEPAKSNIGNNFMGFIGDIVGRVSDKLGGDKSKNLETEDGKINTGEVGNVVVDLINDESIMASMNNMMTSLTDENFNIESVVGGLFGGQIKK